MIRTLYRRALALRSRIVYRQRHRHLTMEQVMGVPLVVLPEVFNPVIFRTGAFLMETARPHIKPGQQVLDMGTGSGVGAILSAQAGAEVIALDINPAAIRCTRINALLNNLEDSISIHQSDLFDALTAEHCFDVVLFNPPFYDSRPQDAYDHAWRGERVIQHFLTILPHYLRPDGVAFVVLSSDSDTPDLMTTTGPLQISIAARRDLINETLTVYRLEATL